MDYFRLHANCVPVKGYRRALIIDVQRNEYHFVPNSMVDVLIELQMNPVSSVMASLLEENDRNTFQTYIEFLTERELAFFTNAPERFPPISTDNNTPYELTDAIIEYSPLIVENLLKIIRELIACGIRYVEIRIEAIHLPDLAPFLQELKNTKIRLVQVLCMYDSSFDHSLVDTYMDTYPIIGTMAIHSYPAHKHPSKFSHRLFYTSECYSNSCCGKIDERFFSANLDFYLLSLKSNNCLSQKVSISKNGDVKNCPSLTGIFGNIQTDRLSDIAKSKEYQYLTSIQKDDISVCKDCEFRYICSDCRAYVNSAFDKPANCKYDPYTATYEV